MIEPLVDVRAIDVPALHCIRPVAAPRGAVGGIPTLQSEMHGGWLGVIVLVAFELVLLTRRGEDVAVWTYLPGWLVQDGQVAELVLGSELGDTGVAAICHTVEGVDVSALPAVSQLVGDPPNRQRSHWYEVIGVAGPPGPITVDRGNGFDRVGTEFLLTAGPLRVIARTGDSSASIVNGAMVRVQCWFEVLAGYEFEAFDLPDVTGDWSVRSIQIERSSIKQVPETGPNGKTILVGMVGDVVELEDVDRMRRRADNRNSTLSMSYVVDLYPR